MSNCLCSVYGRISPFDSNLNIELIFDLYSYYKICLVNSSFFGCRAIDNNIYLSYNYTDKGVM